MKKLFLLMAVSLLVAGCSKEKVQNPTTRFAKVHIHVNDFSISQEEFPKAKEAEDPASYNSIKAITLAFYNGNTEVCKVTQLKTDQSNYTTFGEFDCSLPMGSYTMVVVGYNQISDDAFVLTSPTSAGYTGDHVRETFVATQTVNVTNTDDLEIDATLSRVVAQVKVVSTDARTANAASVRTTFSAGGKSFSPTTGLATSNTGFSNTVVPSASVGTTTNSINFLFLATDEQSMTVTIDVLDDQGNSISQKVVNNVPLKRNRITTLTGSLYSASSSASFQVETAWLEGNNVNF